MLEKAFHKALPLLVGITGVIGASCFAVLAPVEMLNRVTALSITLAGVVSTIGVSILLRKVWRMPSGWHLYSFRRNLVLFLIILCWLFGAIGGFLGFCVLPRGWL